MKRLLSSLLLGVLAGAGLYYSLALVPHVAGTTLEATANDLPATVVSAGFGVLVMFISLRIADDWRGGTLATSIAFLSFGALGYYWTFALLGAGGEPGYSIGLLICGPAVGLLCGSLAGLFVLNRRRRQGDSARPGEVPA